MANPFLPVAGFPDFAKMTPEAADEALPRLLVEATARVDALEKSAPASWDGLVPALADAQRPLWRAWRCITHLLSVCNSDGWRRIQKKYQGDIVAFGLRVDQSRRFYELFGELKARLEAEAKVAPSARLACRVRILEKYMRGAELSGVALDGARQKRFNEIEKETAKLSSAYRDHVLDATKAFSVTLTTRAETEGLTESLKKVLAGDGDPVKGPWRASIEDAVYYPFMKHSKNRPVREALCRARCTRASEGPLDNAPLVARLLALRQELAELLGYGSYAEVSLAQKSAPSVAAVQDLIAQLAAASRPFAAKEDAALNSFAQEAGWTGRIEPWDRAYWNERQREKLYSYSEEELSRYFDLPVVLDGLFKLATRLFGITVEAADGEAPVWHPDVRFYRVRGENGRTIAHFYFDPYSRPATKRGGAWANSFRSRMRLADGSVQLPLALVCCNQAVPDKSGRALMRFSEVETLFHEFGHALQHMLTTVDDEAASGLGLIEWDAVEIASQFMENWCYDETTVKSFARHVDTGEPIPVRLLDRVRAARNYRAANSSLGQLSYAKLDLELHVRPPADPNALKNRIFDELIPGRTIPEDRMLNSFSHIFAGGYAAGYYSYKWSEVMSADVFGAFEEAGLKDEAAVRRLGRRYRDTFLALGGSVAPMEVFRRFRGRAPEVKALLRQSGLVHKR
jgi:oligopeptidase A